MMQNTEQDRLTTMLEGQFAAALAMVTDCIDRCPPEQWDALVAKYPFWLVAYHTLYCTDGYLEPNDESFQPHPVYHPGGWADINEEYPTRRFEKDEVLAYAMHVKEKAKRALAGESSESLAGDSGFKRRTMTRGELYIYTLRHIQHHTGQLSAVLRRQGLDPKWVGRGWE